MERKGDIVFGDNENNLIEQVLGDVGHFFNQNIFELCKRSKDCFVLKTPTHYYKIRKEDTQNPVYYFEKIVREAFAQEYKEMGIDWEVYTIKLRSDSYFVEKREIMQQICELDMSYEEAIAKSAYIKRKVENRLELPYLLAQVRDLFNDKFFKIVLARDCEDDCSNYAIWKDKVIMLGDSNFFLAFISDSFSWMRQCITRLKQVEINSQEFVFTDYNSFEASRPMIEEIYSPAEKWWLFPKNLCDMKKVSDALKKEKEDMFSNNCKILFNKKLVSVKTKKNFGSLNDETLRIEGKESHTLTD